MSKLTRFSPVLLALFLLAAVACETSAGGDADTASGADVVASTDAAGGADAAGTADVAGPQDGSVVPPEDVLTPPEDVATPPEDVATPPEDIVVPPADIATAPSCEPASLREDALANGTPIFAGVTLAESTPIATILADAESYNGQVLQIEGLVVEICQDQGCYVGLADDAGNALNIKVDDGVIDFRTLTQLGRYMVADGVFTGGGSHGAQVFIQNHGAVVGTIVCGD